MTLEDRIRDVLGRLELLAEGATQVLDPDKRETHDYESSVPAGVSLRPSDRSPDKRFCPLFEWYRWQFANTQQREKREALYLLAEMDWREQRFRIEKRQKVKSGSLLDGTTPDGGKSELRSGERIIEWYEGVPALVVAVLEGQGVTEEWVKKARRLHKRNPHDGRPRAEFLDMPESERRLRVSALKERGLRPTTIADKLGISRRTVSRYLGEDTPSQLAPTSA